MFIITDIEDKKHGYVCDNPEDVLEVVLRITKNQKDAENAVAIAKSMDFFDNYICFNKYTMECRHNMDEKYKLVIPQKELDDLLTDSFRRGYKAGRCCEKE